METPDRPLGRQTEQCKEKSAGLLNQRAGLSVDAHSSDSFHCAYFSSVRISIFNDSAASRGEVYC